MRYVEDLKVGDETLFDAEYLVTEEEIIEVGQRWDTLPWHTDPVAAKNSVFGGLVAASAHIFCIWSGLGCAEVDRDKLIGGSVSALGFNNLQWHAPVRPEDVLSRRQVIKLIRASKSKPGLSIVTTAETLMNQKNEIAFTLECSFLCKERTAS